MALRFTDGCDSYATTNDILKKWGAAASNWSWSSSAGVTGGGGLTTTNANSGDLFTPSGILNTTSMAIAFRIKSTGTVLGAASINTWANFFNSTPGVLLSLRFTATGAISVSNGATATLMTGTINVMDGSWHWVEMKFGGSGSDFVGAQLYVDGVLDASSGATNPTTGTYDRFSFTSTSKGAYVIDDVIAYDNVGNAPVFANFPLGPQIIETIRPVSDGTCTFGTVSSGTNHSAMVDDVAGDTTDYVEDGTSGHQDLYNYGSVGSPTTIIGAMLNSFMHNPGAGAMSAKGVCKSGATTSVGTSTAIGAGPKTYQQEFGVDPNTSAAWTAANINSAQFGAKVA